MPAFYEIGIPFETGGCMQAIGRKVWAIAEGYIPPGSTGTSPELISHETVCVLNTGDEPAHVEITVFFTDRDAVGPYVFDIGARRTRHLRFNDFKNPEPIPKGEGFSSVIVSNVPVVVQHTRLDSRQPALALLSTIAFPVS
jgi:hypothetical protein